VAQVAMEAERRLGADLGMISHHPYVHRLVPGLMWNCMLKQK